MPFRPISLRTVWIVPFVFLTLTTVGLIGFLSWHNGQKAVNDLAQQLITHTNRLVTQHLESYLAVPKNLLQLNADALESGTINGQAFTAIGVYLWKQAKRYHLTWINYGLESGEYAGAGYLDTQMAISETSQATGMQNYNFFTNEQGQRIHQEVDPAYDHRKEAWYVDAIRAGQVTWSNIYVWEGAYDTMSVGIGQPIYHGNDQPVGAIGIDLSLTDISKFLRTLQVSPSARLFIIEQNGMLVATSDDEAPFVETKEGKQRFTIDESADPLLRATAAYLRQQAGSFDQIQTSKAFQFSWQGKRQFLQVTPWRDELGLAWWVVVVVAESDFMAQINANTRQTIWLSLSALVVAFALGIFIVRLVTRPAAALKLAAQQVAAGQLKQPVMPSGIHELDAMGHSFNQMAAQLQDSAAKLAYAASHDALTGLPNRARFQHLITEALARHNPSAPRSSASVPPYRLAVLFLDLDYFKLLNDSLGHWAGDQVLIEVSARLRLCVGTNGHVARFGGDEFVILLEPVDQPSDIEPIVEAILGAIQKPFLLKNNTAFINTSIGVAFSSSCLTDADQILRNADIALYRAKANGKAICEVFDDEMHREVIERLQLETDLRSALQRDELLVYYQPIVDVNTLEMVGVEALVRWQHPSLGMIPPAKFIPIAEETGLIIPLGWWVLRHSCQQMQQWLQQFPGTPMPGTPMPGMPMPGTPMVVSVNLSSRQFLQPNFHAQVCQVLQEIGLPPQCLQLEITESLLIREQTIVQARLAQLKALGIKLSLDDFGTGYSSLSYLYQFPLDILKIDRTFVERLLVDQQCGAIVEAIITMAHKLGMKVIAEGVETQEELDYLRDYARCEQIQGFLISAAVPAEAITRRINHSSLLPTILISNLQYSVINTL